MDRANYRRLLRDATGATTRAFTAGGQASVGALTGKNALTSKVGETVHAHDVTIMGPVNLPSSVAYHASQMFGRNILALLQHLVKDGVLVVDPADEITGAMLMVHQGKVLK